MVWQANSQKLAIAMWGARFDQKKLASKHMQFMIRSIIKNAVFLIQLKDL